MFFVADGPNCPTMKRGIHVVKTPHRIKTGAKDIMKVFGFDWIGVSLPTYFVAKPS